MESRWRYERGSDGCGCVGYLFKKTRDGKWQKRWFETNGCFLTYYKVRLPCYFVSDVAISKMTGPMGCRWLF